MTAKNRYNNWKRSFYRAIARIKLGCLQSIKNGSVYHVFLYFWREKVSEQELSDDFGTAYGPFHLSAKL